ncbi:folate-binding protein YgfZ [Amylibacter sp. SFDW26]|uniref:CAF17-like 4Fe-4S cluster assembly/insertion protein YgfZ n=1 Tax=Amylibacter sp. SFDW26 TaxID=2652722 RepID=UPI001261FC07|nr:folate-binding protein YgfZ [Amylibacter sp. SFDW26]KAB7616180.1 folate-binding protein YgfZ [Amylibacter sp. SFDW26]
MNEQATDRTVLKIGGSDARKFLQDLVTNNLSGDGLVYSALLTPQGKYLFDFFILEQDDHWLLDVKSDRSAALAQRLAMYRLRADVTIEDSGLHVRRGLGDLPEDGYLDPRHDDLGWRLYSNEIGQDTDVDWDAIRVKHCIPETGIELVVDDTYILEVGFERLNGVDFRKGCYVGQEISARMKHKTELRKGLARVAIIGSAPIGAPITANGKPVGTLYTQSKGKAIAYLRFDRAKGEMEAEGAAITLL